MGWGGGPGGLVRFAGPFFTLASPLSIIGTMISRRGGKIDAPRSPTARKRFSAILAMSSSPMTSNPTGAHSVNSAKRSPAKWARASWAARGEANAGIARTNRSLRTATSLYDGGQTRRCRVVVHHNTRVREGSSLFALPLGTAGATRVERRRDRQTVVLSERPEVRVPRCDGRFHHTAVPREWETALGHQVPVGERVGVHDAGQGVAEDVGVRGLSRSRSASAGGARSASRTSLEPLGHRLLARR